MFKRLTRLVTVLAAIAAVLGPSAAYARPILPDRQPFFASPSASQMSAPAPVRHATAATSSGFSWHDAGLGAAGMLVLLSVATGATVVLRRRSAGPATS
jgi:hypothetical protein